MVNQKILIVDDEPFNIDYLEQELDELNFVTIAAENGEEALAKVISDPPDLVLLDIMMPVMDGFEVLSRLKNDPATRNIPVIIISAANNLDSVVKGVQLGAEDYLPKPFEPTLLKARISSCLEKKRLHDLESKYMKRLEDEMDVARDIQSGFLPSEIPVSDAWDISVYFKAAKEVAGDFYDVFFLPDGNLVCLIGDVCGKGVGAALFMTLFRSLIRAACTASVFSGSIETAPLSASARLQHAIGFTNNYVAETHSDDNMFATIFIGIFNPVNRILTYMNCGNEPPLLFRKTDQDIVSLVPTGPIIGIIPGAEFKTIEVSIDQDDLLVAFTDGIPDTLNEEDTMYGVENLRRLIQDESSSAIRLCHIIQADVEAFIGDADQFDDITFLAIRRK
jgi:serine phosphatase RsbU (regulator of sigma subunit)